MESWKDNWRHEILLLEKNENLLIMIITNTWW